jgi:hypothetical protein
MSRAVAIDASVRTARERETQRHRSALSPYRIEAGLEFTFRALQRGQFTRVVYPIRRRRGGCGVTSGSERTGYFSSAIQSSRRLEFSRVKRIWPDFETS